VHGEDRYYIIGMVEDHLLFVAYAMRAERVRIISAEWLNHMSAASITRRSAERTKTKRTKHDWSRVDAMTAAERHAAALADPDAQPLTARDFKRMKPVPRAFIIRRALHLSQEEFAARFHIPIGTLRDWEQGRKAPDAAAKAYLRVIASAPEVVRKALAPRPALKR
jgi:putative transcriptional regulator